VSNWNEILLNERKSLKNGRELSVEVSNILRWSFESTDPSWKILHGGFTQSASLVAGVLSATVVTVNDILKISISFQEHAVESIEQVKIMADEMKEFLLAAISST
jgi:hypothetical protein